jgi:hypothetical protein
MGNLESEASARLRFQILMLTALVVIALSLAAASLYGLMAYFIGCPPARSCHPHGSASTSVADESKFLNHPCIVVTRGWHL